MRKTNVVVQDSNEWVGEENRKQESKKDRKTIQGAIANRMCMCVCACACVLDL